MIHIGNITHPQAGLAYPWMIFKRGLDVGQFWRRELAFNNLYSAIQHAQQQSDKYPNVRYMVCNIDHSPVVWKSWDD